MSRKRMQKIHLCLGVMLLCALLTVLFVKADTPEDVLEAAPTPKGIQINTPEELP